MAIALTTTTQLLDALRQRNDGDAWSLLMERYLPVLHGVARQLGLNAADAEDAAQQTLLALIREMRTGNFDRSRGGLRRWTVAVLRNRVRDIQRLNARSPRAVVGTDVESLCDERLMGLWTTQRDRQVLTVALTRLRTETQITEPTIRAFELSCLRGVPVPVAAADCGMSPDEVYVARNRVMSRLRGIVCEVERVMDD